MYYDDMEYRKTDGFHKTHYLADFIKLLEDNKIRIEQGSDALWFIKGTNKIMVHCLTNRQEIFVTLIRNKFIETKDYNFRERK